MCLIFLSAVDPLEVIDKASGASDRWLFLATLVLLLTAGLWAIRYLATSRESENLSALNERSSHAKWVETVYTENVKLTAQVLVVLQETNILLKRIEAYLAKAE